MMSTGSLEEFLMTPEEVLDSLRVQEVKFVDLQFTDLYGRFLHTTIPTHTLSLDDFKAGLPKLDGSSVRGFVGIHESDMVLLPDANTFAIIPWLPEHMKTARLICDIYLGYGLGRFSGDPRAITRKAEEAICNEGFEKSYWGPELEFFVFDKVFFDTVSSFQGQSYRIESREALWNLNGTNFPIRFKEGYFPTPPQDALADYRSECVNILQKSFNIMCEAHHHEVATAGQCEIDVHYDTLTAMADSAMTFKYVIKNVAHQKNMIATFMPKPVFMDNASGMHVHVSLWKKGKNLFYDKDDPYAELSQLSRYFIGGLLEHSRSLSAIVAPTTNSYRRLVPGYEAPVFVAWSRGNRSANVRIPIYQKGASTEHLKRIEFRTPDPSCNPYLCFAAITAAGLDGIRKKIDAGDPIDEDIYKLSPERRRQLGIKELPGSILEALEELQSDQDYLKNIFPKETIDKIIENGMNNHLEIAIRPHPHEFSLYFDV